MEIKYFNISLNINQLNTLLSGLGELPFKVSNELIQEIVRQFTAQQDVAEPPILTDAS